MSETSQDNYPSVELDSPTSPPHSRPKRFSQKRPPSAKPNPELKGGAALLCDTWRIPTRQRLQIGFVGLTFIIPFISLCLIYPEWTGHIGTRLSLGLFSFLGQGALLVPFVSLYLVLSCSGFRALRKTRYMFLLPLFVCTLMLIERWSHTGGWLGRILDRILLAALGPGGAWLMTGTLLSLSLLAFFPRARKEMLQLFSLAFEFLRESRLRLINWWLNLTSSPAKTDAESEAAEEAKHFEIPSEVSKTTPSQALFLSTESHARLQPEGQEAPPSLELPQKVPTIGEDTPFDTTTEAPISLPHSFGLVPEPPSPPKMKDPDLTPQETQGNIIRFADAEEIDDSLELERPNLTGSDDIQAAIPRARTFELPPLVLLDDVPYSERTVPTEDKSKALLDALDAFGVKAKLLQIVRGPTVTRYELQPARGVKVSKFTSLTNDIALALASTSVRIEAPIPGKSAIGIEIPNKHTDLVVLKDILRDSVFYDSKGLTVALGKDLSGRPVVTDLQKMPHLLVAGTTGSGKSVCVNGLIISLLYRFTPDQLQLMMVDPKQVELSVYEDIPHLVGFSESEKGEIIVDPKKAAQALNQVVGLMEARYTLFAENKVRNLAEYNHKFQDTPLPWFVVIIDELADLMMVASKSVETSICRIAQKARAAGIHLVLATQRPSADVITGLIKVNIPSRAAFAVSSQVDSRVILDTSGAEHLLGKGDMLFMPVDASDPKRLQGCYVGNEEISRVVEFWKGQGLPENRIEFEFREDALANIDEDEEDGDSDDALLEEALRAMLERKQASASMIQTQLKVGYARARRLLIAMEKKGWVGPPEGSKPRAILYSGPFPGHSEDT